MTAPTLQLTATWRNEELDRQIYDFHAATGRAVPEIGQQVSKGMVQDILDITPPGSQGNTGQRAKRIGELAVSRDLGAVFAPVTVKGFRMITTVFGRHIATPVKVKTKEEFPAGDMDVIHRLRLASKHGGKVTRGRRKAYYVSRTKLRSLRARLVREVGALAAGWIPAALALGARVPAFIMRHAGRAHGTIQIDHSNGIRITAINEFPAGTADLAADTQRRVEYVKGYAIGRLKRQLEAKLKGLWGKH